MKHRGVLTLEIGTQSCTCGCHWVAANKPVPSLPTCIIQSPSLHTWEFWKISLSVFASILIVPEVCGLTGNRLGTNQLSTFTPNWFSFIIPSFYSHSKIPGLNFSFVNWNCNIVTHETWNYICSTWNGSQEDTAFYVFVDILIALRFERWSCRQDSVECLEIVCFTWF